MPKIKLLSGDEVIKILKRFDFEITAQKGSHMKLFRNKNGLNQTLVIPNHKELKKGTIKAVYNQAKRYVSEDELREYFYSK